MHLGWTALVALLFVAACSRQSPAIEEAKKRQASGDLDAALATLQTVRAGAPGSADDSEASRLATAWLLEAAGRASAPDERRGRLEAALVWTPGSGEAAARLCAVLVDQERDADAEKCLTERLAGKTGVPESVVRAAREKLDARKEQAEASERATLLASGRPAQLKALIDRWPASPEAAQAKGKLGRAESLCADASYTDDMREMLVRMDKLSEELRAARKTPIAPRLDALERIGKDATSLGGLLKNKGIDVEAHAVKDGEEPLRKALHDGFWALADLASDLGEGLQKPAAESDESYDENASHALDGFERGLKKTADKLRKEVDGAVAGCRHEP